jgi:hypothetical protein
MRAKDVRTRAERGEASLGRLARELEAFSVPELLWDWHCLRRRHPASDALPVLLAEFQRRGLDPDAQGHIMPTRRE